MIEIPEEQRMSEGKQLVDSVRSVALDFCGDAMPVNLDMDKIEELADEMEETGKAVFSVESLEGMNQAAMVLVELFASSINYCFWYGRYDFRPMTQDSYSMYEVIINAAKGSFNGIVDATFINAIIDRLSMDRYPLLEQRVKHLLETSISTQEFIMYVMQNKHSHVYLVLHELVRRYPGFAGDMFLKRAFLFVISLNRKLGYFADSINEIPVPADYQVPKMLRHFGCLIYGDMLSYMISNHQLIPKYSKEEIGIRAGTVLACDTLSELTGWNMAEIDAWLWLSRKEVDKPFHLTITTDY